MINLQMATVHLKAMRSEMAAANLDYYVEHMDYILALIDLATADEPTENAD